MKEGNQYNLLSFTNFNILKINKLVLQYFLIKAYFESLKQSNKKIISIELICYYTKNFEL